MLQAITVTRQHCSTETHFWMNFRDIFLWIECYVSESKGRNLGSGVTPLSTKRLFFHDHPQPSRRNVYTTMWRLRRFIVYINSFPRISTMSTITLRLAKFSLIDDTQSMCIQTKQLRHLLSSESFFFINGCRGLRSTTAIGSIPLSCCTDLVWIVKLFVSLRPWLWSCRLSCS